MATWITHLRIAEILIQMNNNLSTKSFIIGNIAADCGVPTKDKKSFNPPKEITHFKEPSISYEEFDNINLEKFYLKYLKDHSRDDYPFFLGYYLHLVVDILWHKFQMNKRKDANYNQFFINEQPQYRLEQLQLDLQYINEITPNIFKEIFNEINEVKDYAPFLPQGILTNHIKHIQSFYTQPYTRLQRPKFTTYDELTQFIDDSVTFIVNHLKDKNVNYN